MIRGEVIIFLNTSENDGDPIGLLEVFRNNKSNL